MTTKAGERVRAAALAPVEKAARSLRWLDSVVDTQPGDSESKPPLVLACGTLAAFRDILIGRDPRLDRMPGPGALRESWRERNAAWCEAMTKAAHAAASLQEMRRCLSAGDAGESAAAAMWFATFLTEGLRALLKAESLPRQKRNAANRSAGKHSELTERQQLATGAHYYRRLRRYLRKDKDSLRAAQGKAKIYTLAWAKRRYGVTLSGRTVTNYNDAYCTVRGLPNIRKAGDVETPR